MPNQVFTATFVLAVASCGVAKAQIASQLQIKIGDSIPNMMWNDPSVLKESGVYRMWLSGGSLTNLNRIVVRIYEARSVDGKTWNINPTPVLEPGLSTAWDSLRVETPVVVRARGIYHMYYSGFTEEGARTGYSSIGHATSLDGVRWTKDPANPVITGQNTNHLGWGYGGVGEPAVVYNAADSTFSVYYVGMRYIPWSPSNGQIGILVAKSLDGSSFQHVLAGGGRRAVLTFDAPYAPPGAWFGYSTPSVVLSKGKVHLFSALLIAAGGPSTARHVRIDRAVSDNGLDFSAAEPALLTAGERDWKDHQVRSPTVIEENTQWRIWIGGETYAPYFSAGIGGASLAKQ